MRTPATRSPERILLLALVALAAAVLAAPRAALAQSDPVLLQVDPYVTRGEERGPPAKLGAWTWLAVEVENTTAAPIDGTLRAARGTSFKAGARSAIAYERHVSLAPHARRLERLLYFVRDPSARVVVGFFADDAPGQPIALATTDVDAPDDFIALVVSREDAAHALLRGALVGGVRRREVYPAALPLAELPDRAEAYEGVNAVLIADVDLRTLAAAQATALEGFVASGGELLLCFGGGGSEFKGTALEPLLPVAPTTEVRTLAVPALAAFADVAPATLEPAPLVAVARPLEGASVVVREGDVPLVVRRRVGAGVVTWLAVDPTRRPLRGSPAGPRIAERLLGAAEPADVEGSGEAAVDPLEAHLASLALASETFRPPPFSVVGAFLAAYVLLVVPVNFAFWRRRGRAERAAPTAAILGVLAGAMVYGLGIAYKGTAGTMSEVVLLEGAAGEPRGHATAFCGIYAPSRRLSRVVSRLAAAPTAPRRTDPEGLDAARAATVHVGPEGAGPARTLDPVELEQWGVRAITARGPAAVPVVKCDLALEAGRVSGTIAAPPGTDLRGALLLVGRRLAVVGDVIAGSVRRIDASLGEPGDGRFDLTGPGARDPVFLSAEELASLAGRRSLPAAEGALDALLVAGIAPDPDPVLAPDFGPPRGRAARLAVLSTALRIPDGGLSLARGLVRGTVTRVVDGKLESARQSGLEYRIAARAANGGAVYYLDKGGYDVEFALPARERLRLDGARVRVGLRFASEAEGVKVSGRGPGGVVDLDLAAADTGRRPAPAGPDSVIELDDPASLYDARAGVLRLSVRLPRGRDLLFLEPEIEVDGARIVPASR